MNYEEAEISMMTAVIIAIVAAIVLAAILISLSLFRRYRRRQEIFIKFQTMAGPLLVYTIKDKNNDLVRVMDVDGAYQSATYLDNKCYDLVFEYHKAYDHMFESGNEIKSMLVLGGGGYAYPKHIVSTRPEIHVDVVEIDHAVTMVAERYFYLDRLIAEFDTEETGQLRLIEGDGREFIDQSSSKYDCIVNDCFSGRSPAMVLASVEAARSIHEHLAPGGLYLSNVISALEGPEAHFINSIYKTLACEFKNVHVVPIPREDVSKRDNNIVIATDGDYSFSDTYDLQLDDDAEIFHDDMSKVYEQIFKVEDL